MSDEHHSIPDDMADRVARLINAAEDMRQQAADDLKQIYADLREELKGLGWQGSAVSFEVAALKGAIAEMRLDEKAKGKREVRGERIDDYVSVLTRARARKASPRKAAEAVSERTAINQPETADEIDQRQAEIEKRGLAGALSAALGVEVEIVRVSNSESAPASQGEAEAHSVERVSLPVYDRSDADANVGGEDEEVAHHPAAQAETIVLEGVSAAPRVAYNLRPNCLKPTNCAGHGSRHCHACTVAARESEEA